LTHKSHKQKVLILKQRKKRDHTSGGDHVLKDLGGELRKKKSPCVGKAG